MSRLQQRRSSLPAISSGALLGITGKAEQRSSTPSTKQRFARLFSRKRSQHSHGSNYGISSMESIPDCIPEDDTFENYVHSPPTLSVLRLDTNLANQYAYDSNESIGSSGVGSEVDMSPRGSIVLDSQACPVPGYRARRGSLPAIVLHPVVSPRQAKRGSLKKSKSFEKLFLRKGHKKQKMFSVTVHVPSGFTQEVDVYDGMTVGDIVRGIAMEQQSLSKYRLYLTSPRALLDLEAEAHLLGSARSLCLEEDEADEEDNKDGDIRLSVLCQLCRSERLYQDNLRSIFDVYAEPLRKFSSLSKDDHKILFFGIEPILSISAMTLLKLEDAVKLWNPEATKIGNLFTKHFWYLHEEYCSNFLHVLSLLREKKENDRELIDFCRLRQGAGKHNLESLLFCPVQRIPNYEQYLSSILAETDTSHPDYDDLHRAVTKVKTMVREREDELEVAENEHKVGNVQERFPNDDLQLHDQAVPPSKKSLQVRRKSAPGGLLLKSLKVKHSNSSSDLAGAGALVPDRTEALIQPSIAPSPNRTYALEGPVQLSTGVQNQDRYLFLFNDLLLVAKQKSSRTFKLKTRVRVCELWTGDCVELVTENSALRAEDRSFVLGWPTSNYVATFPTPHTKQRWLDQLQQCMSSEKEREEPKSVLIRVRHVTASTEHGEQFKSVAVGNTEDAASLLSKCAHEFKLTATSGESEYQLWVRTGKDDPPYPLIGHEQPYSIKMSHVRNSARASGSETPVIPDADLNADLDVQFMLRENKKMPKKASFEEGGKKKSIKSKKSPLNFLMRGKKRDPSPGPTPTGRLYGRPLADVCDQNNDIPKPLYDMLHYLFVHGPYTSGIFRKSPNKRNVMELRDKLDQGLDEDLYEDANPLVVDSALREYLRALPDCLLRQELYAMWASTVQMQDENERFNNTKLVAELLPANNACLLKHLLCVLYHIKQRSEHNKMTAHNLAICISPSLLWSAQTLESGDLSVQSEAAEKIPKVVEYMIEHCVELFGEECIRIFGDVPVAPGKQRGDSSTDSDSINSMLSPSYTQRVSRRDDSSIDSLDQAFITEQGDLTVQPLSGQTKHLSPTNFSCDSGLFSSDQALYEDTNSGENSGDVVTSSGVTSSSRVRGGSGLQRSAPVSRAVSHDSYNTTDIPPSPHTPQLPPQFPDNNYDSAVDMSGSQSSVTSRAVGATTPLSAPPVIPPQQQRPKSKRSQSEALPLSPNSKCVQRMPTVHSGVELRTNPLHHIQSEHSLTEQARNVRAVPKRASGDSNLGSSVGSSLGSVDESGDDFRDMHSRRNESHILRKSESGAKLYIDESLIHSAMYTDPNSQNRLLPTDTPSPGGRPTSYHGGAVVKKSNSNRKLSPPSTRHSWGGQLDADSTTPVASKSRNTSTSRFSLSPSHSIDELHEESGRKDSSPVSSPQRVAPPSTAVSPVSAHNSGAQSDSQQASLALQDKPPHPLAATGADRLKLSPKHSAADPHVSKHQPHSGRRIPPPLSKDLKSKSMDSFPQDQLPPPASNASPSKSGEIKHSPRHVNQRMKKGMTASGGDIYPGQMRRELTGHSTSTLPIRPDSRDRSADALLEAGQARGGVAAARASVHSTAQLSASLPRPPRQVNANQAEARPSQLKRQVALEKSASDQRVSYHMRPHQPPTYQEAIRRKQQLSEAEIEEQKKKSAMARKLHEQSMQMYSQEQSKSKEAYFSEPERSRDSTPVSTLERGAHKPLPTYEQAVKRAEVLKRQGPHPPAYNKTSPQGTPNGREANLSGQSRRRSKSRERGQRLSDTRLESRRKRKSNLSRSKSDSSEHLNRLSNIKQTAYSSSTDTDDDRPVMRTRRLGKSLSKERLNPDTSSPRGSSKSAERPKSVDYSLYLKQLEDLNKADQADSQEKGAIRMRRKSWTVKNRDWHKELADKYTGKAPVSSSAAKQETRGSRQIFAYVSPVPTGASQSQDGDVEDEVSEKPKRRWVPPVHPTKDLITCNSDETLVRKLSSSSQPKSGKDYSLQHVQRSSSHVGSKTQQQQSAAAAPYTPTYLLLEQAAEAAAGTGDDVLERSAHLRSYISAQQGSSDSPPSSTSEREDSDMESSGGLTWSVSKLRGLWDASKQQQQLSATSLPHFDSTPSPRSAHTPASQASKAVPSARPVNAQPARQGAPAYKQSAPTRKDCIIITKEYTNPNAEKQYL